MASFSLKCPGTRSFLAKPGQASQMPKPEGRIKSRVTSTPFASEAMAGEPGPEEAQSARSLIFVVELFAVPFWQEKCWQENELLPVRWTS